LQIGRGTKKDKAPQTSILLKGAAKDVKAFLGLLNTRRTPTSALNAENAG